MGIFSLAKIVDSVIGAGSTISARHLEMPDGNKIIVGENSNLAI